MKDHRITRIEEAATMELRRALTAVAALREMIVELEQENDELRREIDELKGADEKRAFTITCYPDGCRGSFSD